jgi:alcohol dehydrogenase (cytochrome c)
MGGKNWPSMSYSPQTKALYIPYINSCIAFVFKDVEKKPGGGGAGYGAFRFFVDPRADGKLGSLVSMDLDGKILWKKTQAAPFMSATLATAGGLLFVSDIDRYLYALDIRTGDVLWKTRTASTGHGFPASYAVNGRQYIAVPIGYGAPWADEYVPGFKLHPGIPPRPGNGIVVFALPQDR